MAFPTAGILDDFNRGDSTNLGANWTEDSGDWEISSNQLKVTADQENYLTWNTSFDADQEARVKLATKPTTDNIVILLLRWVPASVDGYAIVFWTRSGTDEIGIYVVEASGFTQIGASITSEFSDGDELGADVIGDTITVYKNAASLGSRTDSTYASGGKIGLYVDTTGVRFDDFGGGNVGAATAISLAGSVTPTSNIIRDVLTAYTGQIGSNGEPDLGVQTSFSGNITPSATLAAIKIVLLDVSGAITSSGNLILQVGKYLSGAITSSGSLIKSILTAYTGQITPDGSPDLGVQTSLTGSITSSGSLTGTVGQLLGGAVTPIGSMIRDITTTFLGAVTATGNLLKQLQLAFSGSVVPSGVLEVIRAVLLNLAGAITASGSIIRGVLTAYTGQIGPNGEPDLGVQTGFSGSVTPGGILSVLKLVFLNLTGAITSSGNLIKSVLTAFTGQVDANGNPIAGVQTSLVGSVAPSGALALVSSAVVIAETLFKAMFRGMFRRMR